MSVSQADAKPEPIEIPVIFITCGVIEYYCFRKMDRSKIKKKPTTLRQQMRPTDIANATPASSVLPMCPQNITLMKPIR